MEKMVFGGFVMDYSEDKGIFLIRFWEISKEIIKEILIKSILENTVLFIIWCVLLIGFIWYEIYKSYYHKKKVDPVIEQYIKENPKTVLLIAQADNKTTCSVKDIKKGIKEYKKGIFLLKIRMCSAQNQYVKEFTSLFDKSTPYDFGIFIILINSADLDQPIHITGCIDNRQRLSDSYDATIFSHHYYKVFYAINSNIIDQLESGKHQLQININGKNFMHNNFYIK